MSSETSQRESQLCLGLLLLHRWWEGARRLPLENQTNTLRPGTNILHGCRQSCFEAVLLVRLRPPQSPDSVRPWKSFEIMYRMQLLFHPSDHRQPSIQVNILILWCVTAQNRVIWTSASLSCTNYGVILSPSPQPRLSCTEIPSDIYIYHQKYELNYITSRFN